MHCGWGFGVLGWRTDAVMDSKNSPVTIEGKTFALKDDGSILVCGDQVNGIDSKIFFIKISPEGVAGFSDEFRTFSGYAGMPKLKKLLKLQLLTAKHL